jgi:hypothetical protein
MFFVNSSKYRGLRVLSSLGHPLALSHMFYRFFQQRYLGSFAFFGLFSYALRKTKKPAAVSGLFRLLFSG